MPNYLLEQFETFFSSVKRKCNRVKFQQKLAQYPDWDRDEVTRYGQFQQPEAAGSDDETSPFKSVEYLESELLNEAYDFGFYSSFDLEAASRSPNPDAALKLLVLMRIISEEAYDTWWMNNIEAELWDIITTLETIQQGSDYGQAFLTPNTVELLRSLARRAQGWWGWNDSVGGPAFLSADKVVAWVSYVRRFII